MPAFLSTRAIYPKAYSDTTLLSGDWSSPLEEVRHVLAETGKASERERDLPAHVMIYDAIALALYMTASTREVLRCLRSRGYAGSGARRR